MLSNVILLIDFKSMTERFESTGFFPRMCFMALCATEDMMETFSIGKPNHYFMLML